jgi:hypothetical protein
MGLQVTLFPVFMAEKEGEDNILFEEIISFFIQ